MGKIIRKKTDNNKVAEALVMTVEADDRETVRVFQLLFEKARNVGIYFDPLKLDRGNVVDTD